MRRRKIMKKILFFLLVTLVITTTSNTYSLAGSHEKIIHGDTIPQYMSPYSKIIYVDDSHYKILFGAIAQESYIAKEKRMPTSEEIEIEKHCAKLTLNKDTEEISYKPKKGMKIIYASDGLIYSIHNTIENANAINNPQNSLDVLNLQREILKIKNPIIKLHQWGASKNALYLFYGKTIVGVGRATTFNDVTGQRNNRLKKGDVATKLKYDNCKYGTLVSVHARKKGSKTIKVVSMHKRDVGALPNAVVDIWKTGVNYWGYKYSKYLSLSGRVTIVHEK